MRRWWPAGDDGWEEAIGGDVWRKLTPAGHVYVFKHGRLARLMIPKERLEFRSVEEAKRSFDEARRTPPKFVCPKCEAVTFHPEDVRQRYCGRCHLFADDWDRDYPK